MYRVIRVSSDYGVVVVKTPEDAELKDPRAKYYVYNDNVQGRDAITFMNVPEIEAMRYSSGLADGLGLGGIPEEPFQSLEDVKKWVKESKLRFVKKRAKAAKEAPVIKLPKDKERIKQLRDKLKEYKGRIHPYRAPEMQMNTICKITVLEQLLKQKEINTWELSRTMADKYGSGFDSNVFNIACAVIDDYCKTGGQNVRGGTGLKTPEQG